MTFPAPTFWRAYDQAGKCPPTPTGEVVVLLEGVEREPSQHRRRRSALTRQQRSEDATLADYCAAPWCGRRIRDDEESPRGYCPECEAVVTELEEE